MTDALLITMLACVVLGCIFLILAETGFGRMADIIFGVLSAVSLVTFVIIAVTLIINVKTHGDALDKETAGLTKITAYYEYADDDNYKLITEEDISNADTKDIEQNLYADDFGNVFLVTVKTEKLFKHTATKTEIQPSDSGREIIPKYPNRYQGIPKCKCTENKCSCKKQITE